MDPAVLSALRQVQLIIAGATIGVIGGSLALRLSDDFRPVVATAIVGAVLLGFSFVLQRFASQRIPRLAPAYSSLIGRVVVTLAAALSVVLVFNLLVASDARSVPARPNARATGEPAPAAPAPTAGRVAPTSSVEPVVPAAPQPAVRPPAATPTSSAPPATAVPVSSPAATSPVSPFATPAAPPPSPLPPVPATSSPAQSVAPATPRPTPIASPTSIIPTLPPLPTIRLP